MKHISSNLKKRKFCKQRPLFNPKPRFLQQRKQNVKTHVHIGKQKRDSRGRNFLNENYRKEYLARQTTREDYLEQNAKTPPQTPYRTPKEIAKSRTYLEKIIVKCSLL